MKSLLPAFLLTILGICLDARGGNSIETMFLLILVAGVVFILGLLLFPFAKGRGALHPLVYVGCVCLILLMVVIHFPFRAAFRLSEPALQRLAMRVQKGESFPEPIRAGVFTIKKAGQKNDGSVYLWTDPDPSGPNGFVFHYTGRQYNLWSKMRLDDNWHFICED